MSDMDPHYKELRLRVLAALPGPRDETVYRIAQIMNPKAIPLEVVRAILHDLRNEGLALLALAVDPDEFTPRGSGYLRTQKGEDVLRAALEVAA